MGGGDLNLKKSWHPSTLKNIERVWKAEQKHEAEQKKIEQLQKELAEERTRQEMRQYAEDKGVVRKKQERLDWMYQGPASLVNREDYLTGRPVDKTFELANQENNAFSTNDDNVPESLLTPASDSVVVDLANKIREDPLFVIRKQEEENKKQLLNNPVRMKQLQMLLKDQLDKSNKKKKSKERNKKRRRHQRESKRNKEEGSTSESDSSEGSFVHHRSSKSSGKNRHHEQRKRRDTDDDDTTFSQSNTYGLIETKKLLAGTQKRHVSRKQSTPEKIKMRRTQSRSRSPSSQPSQRRKLMPKEMELKRQQMLNNAKWREEQRNKNMQRYRKEEHLENAMDEQSRATGALFLKPFLASAASHSSVESRVKSNIYNIQRGRGDMESNFARR